MMTKEEYERVLALRRQGLTIKETARRLGYHPSTITKWMRAGGPPDGRVRAEADRVFNPTWTSRVSALLAAEPELVGTDVHKILVAEGFPGSYASVVRHLRTVRGPHPGWAGRSGPPTGVQAPGSSSPRTT